MEEYKAEVYINKQFYYQNGVLNANTQITAIGNSVTEFIGAVKIAEGAGKGNSSLENNLLNSNIILSLDK